MGPSQVIKITYPHRKLGGGLIALGVLGVAAGVYLLLRAIRVLQNEPVMATTGTVTRGTTHDTIEVAYTHNAVTTKGTVKVPFINEKHELAVHLDASGPSVETTDPWLLFGSAMTLTLGLLLLLGGIYSVRKRREHSAAIINGPPA